MDLKFKLNLCLCLIIIFLCYNIVPVKCSKVLQKIISKIPDINLNSPPTESLESIFKTDFNRQTENDVIIHRISDAGQHILDIYENSSKVINVYLFIPLTLFNICTYV